MEKHVAFSGSNRIGKFNVLFEQQADRALWHAIMSTMTVLEAWPNESGRGTTFLAASEHFQELPENTEIPAYRINVAVNAAFPDAELESRRIDVRLEGSVIGIVFTRQIIVRAPPAQIHAMTPATASRH